MNLLSRGIEKKELKNMKINNITRTSDIVFNYINSVENDIIPHLQSEKSISNIINKLKTQSCCSVQITTDFPETLRNNSKEELFYKSILAIKMKMDCYIYDRFLKEYI